jgi:hypothetical protein
VRELQVAPAHGQLDALGRRREVAVLGKEAHVCDGTRAGR